MRRIERRPTSLIWIGVLSMLCCMGITQRVAAEKQEEAWTVPIVIEQSTVRGKIAVLETRSEDRKSLSALSVEIWNTEEVEKRRGRKEYVRKDLIHETLTDEDGFFSLPSLDLGEFILRVGELNLRLTVIPRAPAREGQEEPKTLLILMPKEVVEKREVATEEEEVEGDAESTSTDGEPQD